MKKTIAVVSIIVVIVIVISLIALSGNLPGSTGNKSSTVNKYAPNVVASSDLNASLGGKWSHDGSGYGTSGNVSSFTGLLGGRGSIGTLGYGVQYSPALSSSLTHASSFGNISSFQFSIFSPENSGFAAVGIATYRSQPEANATFYHVSDNVTASANSSHLIAKGNVSGHPYVYVWTHAASTYLSPENQNMSVLLGVYNANLIGIFYLTPGNLSLSNFTSLYQKQISLLSSVSGTPTTQLFVSAAEMGSYLGGTWESQISLNLEIKNASSIVKEFSGLLAKATQAQKALVYQIFGNLSQIAFQGYSSGSHNQSVVAFVKFHNDRLPYSFYLAYLTAVASHSSNVTTGNASGAKFIYSQLTMPSIFGIAGFSMSLIIAYYNDYLVVAFYHGSAAKSALQFENLLKGQVALL